MHQQLGATPFYAKRPLDVITIDTRVANCVHFITTGNCASNPLWDMPNANWWTWGFGAAPAYGFLVQNPSGYDFHGGVTYAYDPVPTTNSYTFTTTFNQDLGVTHETLRNFENCNCGTYPATPMAVDCYSNCNCDCDCNCNCDCGK